MAISVTLKEGRSVLDKCGLGVKMISGSIAFDSSYPTGGESLDLTPYFATQVHLVLIEPQAGYVFAYDYTNKKVMAYWTGATTAAVLAEITNATNLSALSAVHFIAFGK